MSPTSEASVTAAAAAAASMDPDLEANVMRILVATDNHVGYDERQKWGQDALNTLREIMQMAKDQRVDFVLLGGDLYDKNRPSRYTEMKTVEIFREFVMGDAPISVEFVSDPEVNFGTRSHRHAPLVQEVNFMNPNLNIALPVFSIHGNHDDPVGMGEYSAMDLLHTAGLVNYFGRIDNPDPTQGRSTQGDKPVEISPLLFKKGTAKLALYGMSSISNDRANRLFRHNLVNFPRPAEDTEDWVNVFVVHQNRAEYNPKSNLPIECLPAHLDLVIWGHEHECRIVPEEHPIRDGETVMICQPGSSVATSLIHGEAKPKHVGLLKISAEGFAMTPLPLKTIRPMIIKTINIEKELSHVRGTEPEKYIHNEVEKFLRHTVEEILETELDSLFTGHPDQPKEPRIQLKVEYTDPKFVINAVRFGGYYSKRVAQPEKLVLFKTRRLKSDTNGSDVAMDRESLASIIQRTGSSIEEHVTKYFQTTQDDKAQLKLLSIKGMAEGVTYHVDKDYKRGIEELVTMNIEKAVESLLKMGDEEEDPTDELVDEALTRLLGSKRKPLQSEEETRKYLEEKRTTSRKRGGGANVDEDEEEGENFQDGHSSGEETRAVPAGRGRGLRGRGRATRARGARGTPAAKPPVAARSSKNTSIASFFSQNTSTRQSSRTKKSVVYESDSD